MAKKNNKVHIFVDENFYNNLFEINRKNLSMKLGKDVKQHEFTTFIKGFKLKKLPNIQTSFKNSTKFKPPKLKLRSFGL